MIHWKISKSLLMIGAFGMMLSACGTTPAPDYRGKWRPVNNYSETPIEIPLSSTYIFQASPMDGTLKTMLARWAKDSGMDLEYRFGSDFTLFGPVSQIDTTDIRDAAAQLSSAYGPRGVAVAVTGNKITVLAAANPAAPAN